MMATRKVQVGSASEVLGNCAFYRQRSPSIVINRLIDPPQCQKRRRTDFDKTA